MFSCLKLCADQKKYIPTNYKKLTFQSDVGYTSISN